MQIPNMRGFSFIWCSINCSWYLKSGVISTRKQSFPPRTASDAISRFWFESFHASRQQSSEQPVWGYPPSCAVPSTNRLLDAFAWCNVFSGKLGRCYKLFAEFSCLGVLPRSGFHMLITDPSLYLIYRAFYLIIILSFLDDTGI